MAAKRILVFQHLEREHPAYLGELAKADGYEFDTILWADGVEVPSDFSPWSALWVMGGPMDVWEEADYPWLVTEKIAIRLWMQTGKPYLGLCLGHQLLADAMGGSVGLMDKSVVGVRPALLTPAAAEDPLLETLPSLIECFQWHGAEVQTLPPGAVALATSDDTPFEAMRLGNAWSFQFHCEITNETVAEWSSIPANAAILDRSFGGGGTLASDTASAISRLNLFAGAIYRGFAAQMEK